MMALGPVWSSAEPALLPHGEDVRDVSLLKPPHEDLQIRWSATVHEEGGEFLLSRQGPGGSTSVVARVRPRGDGRYAVVEPNAVGAWIYKLRYRNSRGHEHVLVTIHLNVERVGAGHGVMTAATDGQPVALRAALVLSPPHAAAAASSPWDEAASGGPGRWPPTPPP